jgi:hypothetical protein
LRLEILLSSELRPDVSNVDFHKMLDVSVTYPDGSSAVGQDAPIPESDDPIPLALVCYGSAGPSVECVTTWWLSPFPPPGPIAFTVAVPAIGLTRTTTVLEGQDARDAWGGMGQMYPVDDVDFDLN